MKSQPDVEVRSGSDTAPAGGGSPKGADTDKVWNISGQVKVRESQIDGESHDRPLQGIEVKVSASDLGASGPWTSWGKVRTDSDGRFNLSETNNGKDRYFRVQVRLVGTDLEVEDPTIGDIGSLDVTDKNWRTVWKSGSQLDGPSVSVGTRVVAAGGAEELGDVTFRRQALIWHVLRTAIDRLEAEDSWFGLGTKVVAVYPSRHIGGTHQTGGGRIHFHADDAGAWHPDAVLEYLMLLWHDAHTVGSRRISGWPSFHFYRGFGAFASNALLHELWGVRLDRPLNRRAVATALELSTLNEINDDTDGAQNALRLLRNEARKGWWSHRFGTAQTYPDGRLDDHPDEVGIKHRLGRRELPPGPDHLSLWDMLRAFRADPSRGWRTDLDVSDPEGGVLAFIDRALEISAVDPAVGPMVERSLDPLAVEEPHESLPLLDTAR